MTVALVCGADPWVQPDGGSLRVRAFQEALAQLDPVLIFPHSAPGGLPPTSRRKEIKQRYLPLQVRRPALLESIQSQLELVAPDLVVCTSNALTPAAVACGAKAVWVDHMDLWSLFGYREAAHRNGLARWTARAQARLWQLREDRERGQYQVATTASLSDAHVVRDALWLPTPIDVLASRLRPPQARHAGFLANFAYWPNRDAYDLLVSTWLPRLREQGWTVLVAGHESRTLTPAEHVENLGAVPTVADFYERVDLTLAPIRLGGGMKVKVVESLAHGRPVLATPHALDGLPPGLARFAVAAAEPPSDLDAALGALDLGDRLGEALDPFRAARFTTAVQSLARQALA